MAISIVDADIKDLRRDAARRRARSQDTAQLVAAIESLGTGQAKAVLPGSGDTVQKLRAKVAYAAVLLAGK